MSLFFLAIDNITSALFGLKETAFSKTFATTCSILLSTPNTFASDKLDVFLKFIEIFLSKVLMSVLKSSITLSIKGIKSNSLVTDLD